MTKHIILSDIHFGARNNSKIFLKYQEDFFIWLIKYMSTHNITSILMIGDVFDKRRIIDYQILYNTRKIFDKLTHIDITISLGNHDVYYKDSNKINSIDLLLKGYSNIKIITDSVDTSFSTSSNKIGIVPWINSQNSGDILNNIKTEKYDILLGHFEISGFKMYKDGIKIEHGLRQDIFARHGFVGSGHYHHKSSIGNIHYFGSQFQFTWADADDQKYFHIMDDETGDISPVEVPFKMFTYIDEMPEDIETLKDMFVRLKSDDELNEEDVERLKEITHDFKQTGDNKKTNTSDKKTIESEEENIYDMSNKLKFIGQYSENNDFDDSTKQLMMQIYREECV